MSSYSLGAEKNQECTLDVLGSKRLASSPIPLWVGYPDTPKKNSAHLGQALKQHHFGAARH